MNTKNKQDQKNQRQKTRQVQGREKRGQNPNMLHDGRKHHEQENPETRMTR
jgi:hypothetical protein